MNSETADSEALLFYRRLVRNQQHISWIAFESEQACKEESPGFAEECDESRAASAPARE